MSADVVIRAEGLGKRYTIGHQAERERTTSFREMITQRVRHVGSVAGSLARGRPVASTRPTTEDFWALKDVSFEIRRGEVVGIIGRNGAGKSTLLKILSRITEPTEGRVELKGRVASLLEVGTGFHPELTGRENVYLNGAILGMSRSEIRRKFDEIVAFAEVERFLDTPVKRYSSGMYVRLAFAVAAHLEPEILVVDEVLAVGDAEFQKKCMSKLDTFASNDRTVLFVSHDIGAIRTLTSKCILMEGGEIQAIGPTADIVAKYLQKGLSSARGGARDLSYFRRNHVSEPEAELVTIVVNGNSELGTMALGSKLSIALEITVHKSLNGANLSALIKNDEGVLVTTIASWDCSFSLTAEPGRIAVSMEIADLSLAPGNYYLDVGIDPTIDKSCDAVFNFPLTRVTNQGAVVHWLHRPWGSVVCQEVVWSTRR